MGSRMPLRFIGPVIFMLTRGTVVADTFPIVSIKGQACPLPAGMAWMMLLPPSRLMSLLVHQPFRNDHGSEKLLQANAAPLSPLVEMSENGSINCLHEFDFGSWAGRLVICHFLLRLKNSSIESMTRWMSRKSIGIVFNASCVTSRHVATSRSRACRSAAAANSYLTRLSLSDLNSGSDAPASASAASPVSMWKP